MSDLSETIIVRRAVRTDAPVIADVLREAFREYQQFYSPEAYVGTIPGAARILDRLAEGPTWIAVADGQVVGTASAVHKGEHLSLRSVAVRPSARGKGVARKLLVVAESYAVEQACIGLHLETTPFLQTAIHFYRRHGFDLVDTPPRDWYGTPLLTMRKSIVIARG